MLAFETFDQATLPTSLGLWSNGVTLELATSGTYGGGGKSLKATYPAMGTPNGSLYPGGSFDLKPYATDHVYIRFRAKMPGHTHGLKFLKVFGQRSGDSYANTTFGLDYTGVATGTGSMYCVSFGDGSSPSYDTQTTIAFEGCTNAGRATGLPGYQVLTPQAKPFAASEWGTDWHLFELYVKFNSGTSSANEQNNGAIQVRIDGKIYVDARGLFNRHPSNLPIDRIEILGWTQNAWPQVLENGVWVRHELPTPAFEIWYDNLEISLEGWGNSPV